MQQIFIPGSDAHGNNNAIGNAKLTLRLAFSPAAVRGDAGYRSQISANVLMKNAC